MADIKSKLVLDNTQFNKNAKVSKKIIGGLGTGLGALAGAARTASIALVGVAAAFTGVIAVSTRYIDRIGKVNKTTTFSVEALQKFSFAAEQSGVSTEQAQVALRRFSRRLGEAAKGTGELAPTLKRLGIELFTTSGRAKTAEEVLFDLADGIADARNGSEQLSIAFKAFDSEGAELVETLRGGSAGLREFFNEAEALGFVLTTTSVRGVESFADEFNRLRMVVAGVINQFTAALAPVLEQVVELLRNKISAGIEKAGGTMESFGKYLKDQFITIIGKVILALENTFNVLVEIGNAVVKLIRLFGSLFGVELFPSLAVEGQELTSIFDTLAGLVDTAGGLGRIGNLLPGVGKLAGLLEGINELLKDVELNVANIGDKELFKKSTRGKDFVDGLLGNLEENKAAAQEQIDAIEEVVVTGQNLIGETLLGKIFGVGPVKRFWEQWYDAGEESLERFSAVAGLVLGVELVEKIKQGFENSDIGDFTKTLADGLVKGVQMFEDSLADAIVNGKADFSDLADHLKQVLAKAMVQKFITGPIMALFGLASGGPAKAGQPYIVGEEGPELFIPKASGTVIPNDQTMAMAGGAGIGGGGQVTYNINAVDARSFKELVAQDPEYLYNVTQVGARRQPR